jgi:carbonic anhydrase
MRDSMADHPPAPHARRRFLLGGATALAAVPLLGSSRPLPRPHDTADPTHPPLPQAELPGPDQALQWLIQGNERWVTGKLRHPHQTVARRKAVAAEQHPFATIFSCIDSRVPPEIVFDRGIGDLFVVRTAAQTNDGLVQGAV